MTCECDYCGRHTTSCGELRMCPDPNQGGAFFPVCLDCFDAGMPSTDPDRPRWHRLQTVGEWSAAIATMREAVWDEFAQAVRERRAWL